MSFRFPTSIRITTGLKEFIGNSLSGSHSAKLIVRSFLIDAQHRALDFDFRGVDQRLWCRKQCDNAAGQNSSLFCAAQVFLNFVLFKETTLPWEGQIPIDVLGADARAR